MPGMEHAGDSPVRVADLAARGARVLHAAGIDTARLDAELLLAAACGCGRTRLHTRPYDAVPADSGGRFAELLARRAGREPLQYILGRQEFWSLDFAVSPAVLIPRPESERLVEIAVQHARTAGRRRLRICDVGTGSGCLAVALAVALPDAEIDAVDVSPGALAVARENAVRCGVADRVRFRASDLFAAFDGERFDLVVANPPYLDATEMDGLQPELAWEPRGALDGGGDGLAVIRPLVAAAPEFLGDGGLLLVEIGASQGEAVAAAAAGAGLRDVRVEADAAGLPRVVVARK